MGSPIDDEIWELVGEERAPAPGHLAAFVESLGPVSDALDLGCGDGRLTAWLVADRLTGADVSALALARASRRLPGARLVELEPDARLPFDDGAFELVVCADALEHVRDTQLLLSEARRVLVPSGRLAVTVPAHGRLTGLRIAALGFESAFDPLSPHLRFYTRRSLAELLDAMGFDAPTIERRRGTLLCVATR